MVVNAESAVQLAGPWSHRTVSANGTRFHIAEAGDGPLVLMLHGFPEFWWTWRHQLACLEGASRGGGGPAATAAATSHLRPTCYPAADAAGLIRAWETNAVCGPRLGAGGG
jgi:pimeloyl-ACP methyl ester carboxylesterase